MSLQQAEELECTLTESIKTIIREKNEDEEEKQSSQSTADGEESDEEVDTSPKQQQRTFIKRKQHTIGTFFKRFTQEEDIMTLTQFLKMMTDCEMFDDKFTRNTASILFTKLKGKHSSSVCLASFKPCVDMIAEIKGCERTVVLRKMRDTHGPKYTSISNCSSPQSQSRKLDSQDEISQFTRNSKKRQTVKF